MELVISKSPDSVQVEAANCPCPKGLGEGCSHVGALMYSIAHLKRLDFKVIPEDPAKTSLPQTWHQPRGKKVSGQEVQDVVSHGYNKRRGPLETPKRSLQSTLYNPVRGEMPNFDELHVVLSEVAPDAMILPALVNTMEVSKVQTRFGAFPRGSVIAVHQKLNSECILNIYDGYDFPLLPVKNNMDNKDSLSYLPLEYAKLMKLEMLKCSLDTIHKYEKLTRLQLKCPLWYEIKKRQTWSIQNA